MIPQSITRIVSPLVSDSSELRRRLRSGLAMGFAFVVFQAGVAFAETWNLGTGATWNSGANWSPATIPDGTGASVIFNNAASGSNPAQTANRSITTDGARTVGSIVLNNDAANTFTTSITTGTGGPLTFDQTGAGPATINVPAVVGTGNFTISVATVFNDDVVATVDNTTATSASGALNLTTAISGPGGFTRLGVGLATFGTGAKTYTGPTVLGGGRMRMSLLASPTATSSFTINAGGQLDLISAGTYTFGSGPLNLNGSGPATGPFSPFPGAIRPDTGLAITINNAAVLQSDTLLHMQGSASGSLTMAGNISGPGKLYYTSALHDANLGTLVLQGDNSYTGGTVVDGGTVLVNGTLASLGTGDVTVHSAHAVFAGASAKVSIGAGVVNAINDNATLSLAGGNAAGVADDGYIDLGSGVNEVIGKLVLGGVTQLPGTYGSTASTALFQNDEYFAGTGMVTVRPTLTITLSIPNVVVSWSTNAVGYTLQGTGALGDAWGDDSSPVVINDTNFTVTEFAPTNKFFRLKQ